MSVRPFTALFATAAAAASLLALQAPAAAGGVEVRHGDLDLATAAGRQELQARIRRAATILCFNGDNAVTGSRLPTKACQRDMTAQVTAQVEKALPRTGAVQTAALTNGSAPAAP